MERPRLNDYDPDEDMNNFHGHMPGGVYRPDSAVMNGLYEKYGHFLHEALESWPQEDEELLLSLRLDLDIQRLIDSFLVEDKVIGMEWETNKESFSGGGSSDLRDRILRPIYAKLRETFTEDELSG